MQINSPADLVPHLDGTCRCSSNQPAGPHAIAMFKAHQQSQDTVAKVLQQLEPHLQGRPVGMTLISDAGHHVAAVWGGTTETNMDAATKALMTIGSSSMEFEKRPH